MRSLLVSFLLGFSMLLAACSSPPAAQSGSDQRSADATTAVLPDDVSDAAGRGEPAVDTGSSDPGDAAVKTVPWNTINRQPPGWYATPAAAAIAANILYYQNGDGGWPQNIDITQRTAARHRSTIDNAGTTTQMLFLAKIYTATGTGAYKDAFLKALDYLLATQYANV